MSADVELLSLLITAGADINRPDEFYWTPLYKAARNGHTECVQLLLATPDININKWSCSEGRPLDVAKDYNHEECAQCLRQAGAR